MQLIKFCSFTLAVLVSTSYVRGDVSCMECKEFVGELDEYFATNPGCLNETVTIMKDQMCPTLPPNATKCREMMPIIWPKMIRELIELENSEVVCKDIGICTENNDDSYTQTSTPTCDDCLALVDNVASLFNTTKFQQAAINRFKVDCEDHEAAGLIAGCKATVETTIPTIFEEFDVVTESHRTTYCCELSDLCCE